MYNKLNIEQFFPFCDHFIRNVASRNGHSFGVIGEGILMPGQGSHYCSFNPISVTGSGFDLIIRFDLI